MNATAKWKIAALTLVTLPVAVWLSLTMPELHAAGPLVVLGFVPMFVALAMELRAAWKQASERPESYVEGSPAGNKIAAGLAVVLAAFLVWVVCSVARQHTKLLVQADAQKPRAA